MSKNRSGSFIMGMLVGTAIGAIAGILVAPRSGRQTRQRLKKSVEALPELADDLAKTVQSQADRLSESTLRNWDETLQRLREAIAAGLEASKQERETLNQLDNGFSTKSAAKNSSPDWTQIITLDP